MFRKRTIAYRVGVGGKLIESWFLLMIRATTSFIEQFGNEATFLDYISSFIIIVVSN